MSNIYNYESSENSDSGSATPTAKFFKGMTLRKSSSNYLGSRVIRSVANKLEKLRPSRYSKELLPRQENITNVENKKTTPNDIVKYLKDVKADASAREIQFSFEMLKSEREFTELSSLLKEAELPQKKSSKSSQPYQLSTNDRDLTLANLSLTASNDNDVNETENCINKPHQHSKDTLLEKYPYLQKDTSSNIETFEGEIETAKKELSALSQQIEKQREKHHCSKIIQSECDHIFKALVILATRSLDLADVHHSSFYQRTSNNPANWKSELQVVTSGIFERSLKFFSIGEDVENPDLLAGNFKHVKHLLEDSDGVKDVAFHAKDRCEAQDSDIEEAAFYAGIAVVQKQPIDILNIGNFDLLDGKTTKILKKKRAKSLTNSIQNENDDTFIKITKTDEILDSEQLIAQSLEILESLDDFDLPIETDGCLSSSNFQDGVFIDTESWAFKKSLELV
ncbi:hypothetical protein HK096_009603 [Nowakowskiella sp. JEL0078]|nr:hypothetical protein HK096_009603 [Nowakowskiella sp. JEL0078]